MKSRRMCEEGEIFRKAIGSTGLEFTRGFQVGKRKDSWKRDIKEEQEQLQPER